MNVKMVAGYMLSALLMAVIATTNAVVVAPVANLYSGPSTDKDVVSQAIYGWNLEVIENQGDWMRVRTPDQYTGWTPATSLVKRDTKFAASDKAAEVSTLAAHVYREPSVTKHAPIVTLPFEGRVEITNEPSQENRRWLAIKLADGRDGYIQRGDVLIGAGKMTIPEMTAFSRRFLGLPYTWGGTSSFGYDCSGFAQMLCRRRGLILPRDAQPQADWSGSTKIAQVSDLQAGDLLYFGASDKKITHTGIYLGEGEFIHATTSGASPVIQISKVTDWTNKLVAMRRPKGE